MAGTDWGYRGIGRVKTAELVPSFALYWAKLLGCEKYLPERLRGGVNSQVFRCDNGRHKWVIKGYAPVQQSGRDRMKSELQFLKFASRVAPNFTPTVIHVDYGHRCIVLENVDGKILAEEESPPKDAIYKAVEFIRLLNRDTSIGEDIIEMDAAEGFLSLSDHLENVKLRLEAMSCDHLEKDSKKCGATLLSLIKSELAHVEGAIEKQIALGLIPDKIMKSQRCISPSDFGFHNAILTQSGVRFIDFEFAGWDDPAKLIVDFILQPRVPVYQYGSPLSEIWQGSEHNWVHVRCVQLSSILRLKWLCIILGILNPTRLEKLRFVMSGEEATELIQKRLAVARQYINSHKEWPRWSAG